MANSNEFSTLLIREVVSPFFSPEICKDTGIIQEAWVEGDDVEAEGAMKVDVGFR